MLKNTHLSTNLTPFASDTYEWFQRRRHGHMGKWQYLEPRYSDDPCRGQELWDRWENCSSSGNMLKRQHRIILNHANDFPKIAPHAKALIDLGPGGKEAVLSNTLPVVYAYKDTLSDYIAVDMNIEFAKEAAKLITCYSGVKSHVFPCDFTQPIPAFPHVTPAVGLFCGGTIGNFEGEPNTPHAIKLMSLRIAALRNSIPKGSYVFICLEATQDNDLLYGDYDHPAHAEFEINIMHGIKRDLLHNEDGYDPYAWKYEMKWWPEAFQFCHIAEATKDHKFTMLGEKIYLPKGTQLIIDNSFKFPTLAMIRAAQIAQAKYVKTFYDEDNRMAMHTIIL